VRSKSVAILGGGTAGLIVALMLREKCPYTKITVVKSDDIGIVGVGEGSTEHWSWFMRYVGIKKNELIKKTDATFKGGIVFANWNGDQKKYVHSIFRNDNVSPLNRLDLFKAMHCYSKKNIKCSPLFEEVFLNNLVPVHETFDVVNQYHFDTFKLNTFLIEECKKKQIEFVLTDVVDVELDQRGDVKALVSKDKKNIPADFFVDSSGLSRVLSKKMNIGWRSYKEYLPLNRAIAFPTEHTDVNYEPYTLSTSMSSGWMWKIPTQQRYGNGYVFDENVINSEQAVREASAHLGIEVEKVARDIKFEAGKVERFWANNVLSIGLAGSFCEPLEAQSIGFTILQSFGFVDCFEQWFCNREFVEKKYNEIFNDSFDNVVSFLQLHYFSKRKDTKFWKELEFKSTSFNLETTSIFSKGYCDPFVFEDKKYYMFKASNFFQVYSGLDLFDTHHMKDALNNNKVSYINSLQQRYLDVDENVVVPLVVKHCDALTIICNGQ